MFGLGPELHGQAILRSGANTAADVIPADHQIAAVLCLAADQKMHVRIVGIVVINRNPVELGAEISLHVGDELPREGPEIGHFGSVIGAHDKSKMVSVIPATLREGPFVREIGLSGEHACRFAGPGYAIALEIANVR